jgi:CHAT domain-containing protein
LFTAETQEVAEMNADLVVLSGCRTALGSEIKGEGLVGLTRGFMYAGTASVVASLWDVRDEATSELMSRFYERCSRIG